MHITVVILALLYQYYSLLFDSLLFTSNYQNDRDNKYGCADKYSAIHKELLRHIHNYRIGIGVKKPVILAREED